MKKIFKQIQEIATTDDVPVEHAMGKLFEEVGELAQCINMTNGMKVTNLTQPQIQAEVLQEGVDVIQNVFWILQKFGYTYKDVKEMFKAKNAKWEEKIKEKQDLNRGL